VCSAHNLKKALPLVPTKTTFIGTFMSRRNEPLIVPSGLRLKGQKHQDQRQTVHLLAHARIRSAAFIRFSYEFA
jgi:hypothetical protein